jgi:hypothetical protein
MKYWGDKMKENEMGRVCSTHEGDRKLCKFLQKIQKCRDYLEDINIHWRIVLKLILINRVGVYGLDSPGLE